MTRCTARARPRAPRVAQPVHEQGRQHLELVGAQPERRDHLGAELAAMVSGTARPRNETVRFVRPARAATHAAVPPVPGRRLVEQGPGVVDRVDVERVVDGAGHDAVEQRLDLGGRRLGQAAPRRVMSEPRHQSAAARAASSAAASTR